MRHVALPILGRMVPSLNRPCADQLLLDAFEGSLPDFNAAGPLVLRQSLPWARVQGRAAVRPALSFAVCGIGPHESESAYCALLADRSAAVQQLCGKFEDCRWSKGKVHRAKSA